MTVEIKINTLIKELNSNGRNVPASIWDLQDELGYQLFDDFTADVSSGKVRVLRHSKEMNSSLFSMLARPKEKALAWLGQVLFWLGLPFSIALVVFFSWWFLLVAPISYFIGSKLIMSTYNSTIFNAATKYEVGFCLLYYVGQISVGNPENYEIAYYEGD